MSTKPATEHDMITKLLSFGKNCTNYHRYNYSYYSREHTLCKYLDFIAQCVQSKTLGFTITQAGTDAIVGLMCKLNKHCIAGCSVKCMTNLIATIPITEQNIDTILDKSNFYAYKKFLTPVIDGKKKLTNFVPRIIKAKMFDAYTCGPLIAYIEKYPLTEADALLIMSKAFDQDTYKKILSNITINQKIVDTYIKAGAIHIDTVNTMLTQKGVVLNETHLNTLLDRTLPEIYTQTNGNWTTTRNSTCHDIKPVVNLLLKRLKTLKQDTFVKLVKKKIRVEEPEKYGVKIDTSVTTLCHNMDWYPYGMFPHKPSIEELVPLISKRSPLEMHTLFKKHKLTPDQACLDYAIDNTLEDHVELFTNQGLMPNKDTTHRFFETALSWKAHMAKCILARYHQRIEELEATVKELRENRFVASSEDTPDAESVEDLSDRESGSDSEEADDEKSSDSDDDSDKKESTTSVSSTLAKNKKKRTTKATKTKGKKSGNTDAVKNVMKEFISVSTSVSESEQKPVRKKRARKIKGKEDSDTGSPDSVTVDTTEDTEEVTKPTIVDGKEMYVVPKKFAKSLKIRAKKISLLELKDKVLAHIIGQNLSSDTGSIKIDDTLADVFSTEKKSCSFEEMETMVEKAFV